MYAASTIESPCVKTCRLEADKCTGCGRTKWEIMHWTKIEANERRDIMRRLQNEARG